MKINNLKHSSLAFKALYVNIEPGYEGIHLIGHTMRNPDDAFLKLATSSAQIDERCWFSHAIKVATPKNLDLLMAQFNSTQTGNEESTVRNFLAKTFQEPDIVKPFRKLCDYLNEKKPNFYDSSLKILEKVQNLIIHGEYSSYFSYGHVNSTKIITILH